MEIKSCAANRRQCRCTIGFLVDPTPTSVFPGKGGVGETSLSTAAALTVADAGRCWQEGATGQHGAASNLDEMLGVALLHSQTPAPYAPGLWVLNIEPDNAAESYRQRVLEKMGAAATETERSTVREQLSGACTTEIASFDDFASLLSDDGEHFKHIAFDTAPTGHTLRLPSLPKEPCLPTCRVPSARFSWTCWRAPSGKT